MDISKIERTIKLKNQSGFFYCNSSSTAARNMVSAVQGTSESLPTAKRTHR
jgi:hypothetical protein